MCAYDKNLLTSDHQILLNGRTQVCDITDSNGYFSMYGINDDPDDNTRMDLRLGVLLENDDAKIII